MGDIPIELTVWEGDFGLPSMCSDCIYMMLYTKIANVPVTYKYHKNPYWDVGESFPIFQHGRIFTTNLQLMLGYLRIKRYGTEFGLSSKQCSQSYAFMNLLENTLKPVVEYVWWVNRKNFDEFTRPWYTKAMPIPFNFVYPRHRRRKAENIVAAICTETDSFEFIHSYMFNTAEKCFQALKVRLGKAPYFYGGSPTSLDAMVYAYLAPLIKLPFPSNDIPRLLRTYTELVDFVKRIDTEYYPDMKADSKFTLEDQKATEDQPLSFGAKLFTCIFVASAMLIYAVTHKLIILPNYLSIGV
ncbi:metaxin-1-like [Onthophagus taurus]|uniref:metaxin-1-like n=1 Tax=Onthophagus taurus TaxID=166361 RepID=UPI000C1FF718|nr:metaxin-1-like [Onthophagus taurus]